MENILVNMVRNGKLSLSSGLAVICISAFTVLVGLASDSFVSRIVDVEFDVIRSITLLMVAALSGFMSVYTRDKPILLDDRVLALLDNPIVQKLGVAGLGAKKVRNDNITDVNIHSDELESIRTELEIE
jgi:hypothetical protein